MKDMGRRIFFARARAIVHIAPRLVLACAFCVAPLILPLPAFAAPDRALARGSAASEAVGAADVAALIVDLRNPKPGTRAKARAALAKAGPEAVPALIEALKSPELRIQAGAALMQAAGPKSADQAPALLACLHDAAVNHYCGTALVKVMGPKAKGQIPRLIEALKDPDAMVRLYAVAALGRIGSRSKSAAQALQDAAQDEIPEVRRAAEEALRGDD